MNLLTTTQAAAQLGITQRGVQKLIERGKLRATRIGRDNLVTAADVAAAKKRAKPGRPSATAK